MAPYVLTQVSMQFYSRSLSDFLLTNPHVYTKFNLTVYHSEVLTFITLLPKVQHSPHDWRYIYVPIYCLFLDNKSHPCLLWKGKYQLLL